jgi:hypothetical protein
MKYVAALAVGFTLLSCQVGFGQKGPPTSVSFNRLIEKPENFNEELVRVHGFLVIEIQPRHAPLVILYLGQEDAKNPRTKNGILVIPSQEMMQSQERINRRYVSLTGTFRAARAPNGSYGPEIKDIRNFTLWSDPTHPVDEPSPEVKPDR